MILWVIQIALIQYCFAGRVRNLLVGDNTMEIINLRMGRSTILRFNDTPQKIVVGNQNYFNIEFIGNDVTIQPQAQVTTNLFVYGKYHTYGFILQVGQLNNYDDRVDIRRKPVHFINHSKKTVSKQDFKSKNIAIKNIILDQQLKMSVMPLNRDESRNLFILDLEVENLTNKKINLNQLKASLSNKNKLKKQTFILKQDHIDPKEVVKGRIIFRTEKIETLYLKFELGISEASIVIPKDAILKPH